MSKKECFLEQTIDNMILDIKKGAIKANTNQNFKLEAYMDHGWVLSITDINGNLVKQLEWSDFGFSEDDIFTSDEMTAMGFEVV